MQDISKQWLSALNTAAANSQQKNNTIKNDSEIKYSLTESFNEDTDFTKNISKVINMKSVCDMNGSEFGKGQTDLITQVADYFDKIGNIAHSKYGDVILNRVGAKASLGHGIGRNKAIAFTAVPNVIEQGEIIDFQKNWKGRKYDTAVFAAPITIADSSYYMAVIVNVYANDNTYYLHEVALTKKEDNMPFKTGTTQMGTPSGKSSSIYSLLEKLQNVKNNSMQGNEKNSLDVDSEGNKLSKQQQEYFKDSKALDENGNLLVLYHQTGADFTIFNTDNQKAGKYDSEMPTGIFLKPTKNDIGLTGKKQMEVYTNMVNPLVFNNRSDAKRYFEKNIPGYREAQQKISDIDKEYQKKYDEADLRDDEVYAQLFQDFKDKKITSQEFKQGIEETETKRILNKWTNESDNARFEAKLLIDSYFANSEYDSMIVKSDTGSFGRSVTSYIAFNSNQIKNVDNTNPTDNDDIRYSINVDYSYKTLISKPDMQITEIDTAVDEVINSNGAVNWNHKTKKYLLFQLK